MDGELLLNLVETCVFDFEGEDFEDLLPKVQKELPLLLRSSRPHDFEFAQGIARTLAQGLGATLSPACCKLLLDVAFAHIPRGVVREGLSLAESALDIARRCQDLPLIRRAYGVLAALSIELGAFGRGVEYAMRALALAERLQDAHAVAAAHANLSAGLFGLGLYRETVAFAARCLSQYGNVPECAQPLAIVRINMAASLFAMQEYRGASRASELSVRALGLPTDFSGILNRVIAENTWLNAAIELDEAQVAAKRSDVIYQLCKAYKSPRLELKQQLAEAAYEMYRGDPAVAIARLLELRKHVVGQSGLYRDVLALLVRTYHRHGDHAGAVLYLGELLEFQAAHQVERVRAQLEALQISERAQAPGKDDVRNLIRTLQAQAGKPAKKLELPFEKAQELFERLAVSAELREDPSGCHAYRVGRLSYLLATKAGYGDRYAQEVERAARLHDLGKLAVPDAILIKRSLLTRAEEAVLHRHVDVGLRIVALCPPSYFLMAKAVIAGRYERWDGEGFPKRLLGETIPKEARMVAIAEAYDVLTHERPEREALSHELACTRLREQAGKQFDPELVAIFVDAVDYLLRARGERAFKEWLEEPAQEAPLVRARQAMTRYLDALGPLEADPEEDIEQTSRKHTCEHSDPQLPRV